MRLSFFLPLILLLYGCGRHAAESGPAAVPEVPYPDVSELEVVPIMAPGTTGDIVAFDILGPEGEQFHHITFRDDVDRGEWTFWLLRLPYDGGFFGPAMWDPVPVPGVPTLLVMEYTPPGNAPESFQWLIRIILYEEGHFREIPPIRGYGEMFFFRDFNGSGSMEFANSDLIRWHNTFDDGIPISPLVQRFNGERYVPVTEEDVWDQVMERYWEERRVRD
jgi:hypothetical protein